MRHSTLSGSLLLAVALTVPVSAITGGKFGQCGGEGKLQALCPIGYKCQAVSVYYSQCVPEHYVDPPRIPKDLSVLNSNAKRATPPFDPVVGATSCSCQHRRKIQTLQSSYPAQFNMLILALESLMATPESLDISWFQIAGIHGAPKIPYQQDPAGPFNWNLGYCTHSSRLFTTWHRPYVALMEQSMQRRAIMIASQFTGSAYTSYSAAADQLRLPYWDWAESLAGTCLPPITMQATIGVTKPGTGGVATSVTIPNPLFQYNFQSQATLQLYFAGYFAQWMYTRRAPGAAPGYSSQNSVSCANMQNGYTTRRSQTYTALTQALYNPFSSQLEGVHNGVHNNVGGLTNPQGHMGTVDYAAFDPIFWLHHVNVDRLTAMYQASHPNIFLTAGQPTPTFGRIVPGVDGPQDNLQTNLYPFRNANGVFWKSDDIKMAPSIWGLKYGYDEVPCSYSTQSQDALRIFATKRINALYGPPIVIGPFTQVGNIFIRDDFTIRALIDASEIPGSWTLHTFFGKPSGVPADYATAANRIASISAFGNPGKRMDSNSSMIYDNEILLSDVLYERKVDYKKASIIQYLIDNLYWAITTDDLLEVPIDSLKTFKYGVYTSVGNYTDPKDSDILPTYGNITYLPEITRGKLGGISSDKEILYPILLNGTQVNITALQL